MVSHAQVLVLMVTSTAAAVQLVIVVQRTIFKIKVSTVVQDVKAASENVTLVSPNHQTHQELQALLKMVKLVVQLSTRGVLQVFAVLVATSVVVVLTSVVLPTGARLTGAVVDRILRSQQMSQMFVQQHEEGEPIIFHGRELSRILLTMLRHTNSLLNLGIS